MGEAEVSKGVEKSTQIAEGQGDVCHDQLCNACTADCKAKLGRVLQPEEDSLMILINERNHE